MKNQSSSTRHKHTIIIEHKYYLQNDKGQTASFVNGFPNSLIGPFTVYERKYVTTYVRRVLHKTHTSFTVTQKPPQSRFTDISSIHAKTIQVPLYFLPIIFHRSGRNSLLKLIPTLSLATTSSTLIYHIYLIVPWH